MSCLVLGSKEAGRERSGVGRRGQLARSRKYTASVSEISDTTLKNNSSKGVRGGINIFVAQHIYSYSFSTSV